MPTYPDIPYDYGSGEKVVTRIIEHTFGDGYSETAPDGINFVRREFDIQYKNISIADAQTIINFLTTNAGYSFDFIPARENEAVTVKQSGNLSVKEVGFDAKSLSFKLDQVFV